MRVLLGPPPALLRLQSKVPSRDQAPIAELGTLCLRLDSAPLRVASWGWGWGVCRGRDAQAAVALGCRPSTHSPGDLSDTHQTHQQTGASRSRCV